MAKKVIFGSKNPKAFVMPDLEDIAHCSKHESLIFLGTSADDPSKRWCVGIGRVSFINHGEKMDIVGINFGRSYSRQIVVVHNQARRQVYSLKKTQLAWFYGFVKIYNIDGQIRTQFFARGFQPWYVPKALDIKNFNFDSVDQLEKENETSMLNFIDDLLKGEKK